MNGLGEALQSIINAYRAEKTLQLEELGELIAAQKRETAARNAAKKIVKYGRGSKQRRLNRMERAVSLMFRAAEETGSLFLQPAVVTRERVALRMNADGFAARHFHVGAWSEDFRPSALGQGDFKRSEEDSAVI